MRVTAWYWAGLIGLALISICSLFVGVIDLSASDLLHDKEALRVLGISRFPRTMAAIIAGAAMAVSGSVMQMLVRNRFVEPMTAGTGQGAALGILIVTLFFPAASIFVKMAIATVTALVASLGFLVIVRRLPPTQPLLVPLVGLIYGGIIGAAVVFVAYQADLLQYISVWLNGAFSGVLRGRYELLWLAAGGAVLTYFAADQFAIVGMGQTITTSLGLDYKQIVLVGLIAISAISALTVTTVGIIPFVGLIVPNIVSRLFGDNLRRTLPLVAITGAGLTLVSDIIGRIVRYPFEVPVGTVLGVIGAVVFLWLLFRKPQYA
ncbi:iron complex transport system permease protein [Yoonia tamlensis]|uniref:Iron complex transport system permease protein n=1 Tax=Yoonia tamlensis TaxID=390270 RepID=A0A1I6I2D1_9RHOB|nr:iron chelate uptake ABC transporter family permease subunit [Yoonia tamlensis]SFR60788.1 iron complex transport system permease protein [Yoonia tamlensis]